MLKVSELKFETPNSEAKALTEEKIAELLKQLDGWEAIDYGGSAALYKSYKTKNFLEAQKLACAVGEVAEQYNHHPILSYTWGKLEVYWFTHSLQGVHLNDFLLAYETDEAAASSGLLQ